MSKTKWLPLCLALCAAFLPATSWATTPAPEDCFDSEAEICTEALAEDAEDDPFGGEVEPLTVGGQLLLDNSGMLDGIYQCGMTFAGYADPARQLYVSLNGKRNGDTIFIIGELDASETGFYGYGMGRVADETDGTTYTFSGKTEAGQGFAISASYQPDDSVRATGSGGVTFTDAQGKPLNLVGQLACTSIW